MALLQLILVFSLVLIFESQAKKKVAWIELGNVQQGVWATNAVLQQAALPQVALPHPLANLDLEEMKTMDQEYQMPPITLPKSCKHLSIANEDFEEGWQWINPKSNKVKDAIRVYCKEDGSSCIYPNEFKKRLLLSPDIEIKYSEHEVRVLQKISRNAEQEIKYSCNASNYYGAKFKLYNQNGAVISTPNLHPEIQFGVCNGTAPGNVIIEDFNNLPIVKYNEKDSNVKEVIVGPVCYK